MAFALYVNSISQRSGILVNLTIPPELKRLPGGLDLVLFRILQESLTNVLRHAESKAVDVWVELGDDRITLDVQDYGKGLPPDLLERFRTGGGASGIGLNSMRERSLQVDGRFEIRSDEHGTLVRAVLPFPASRSPNMAMAAANSPDDH